MLSGVLMNRYLRMTLLTLSIFAALGGLSGFVLWGLWPNITDWVMRCSTGREAHACGVAAFFANCWWLLFFPVVLLALATARLVAGMVLSRERSW